MSDLTIHQVRTTIDGMAALGRSRHDLMGIRYGEGDGGNAPAAPAAPATPQAPPAAPPAAPAAPAEPPARPAGENVADLPAWAQKLITDTRTEAGNHRTAAKTAGDTATKELTDKLAVALGLKPDVAADPAALTASLTASQAAALASARELAIYKAAGATADPAKLLDSNTFLASVSGIDPADGPAILAAITAAVAANPNLKAARAAGASGTELGGTGEQGQITESQLAQMTSEQIKAAFDKGLLKGLL